MALPCVVAFLVIPGTIMRGLFMRGAFNAEDAHAAAMTLAAYTVGLIPFVLIRSVVAPFLARGDTATPVKAALTGTAVNIAFKIALMGSLAQVGLALATSIGAWINFILVLWFAGRAGLIAADATLKSSLGQARGGRRCVRGLAFDRRRPSSHLCYRRCPGSALSRNCWCWRCSAARFTAGLSLVLFGRRWLSLMRAQAQTRRRRRWTPSKARRHRPPGRTKFSWGKKRCA